MAMPTLPPVGPPDNSTLSPQPSAAPVMSPNVVSGNGDDSSGLDADAVPVMARPVAEPQPGGAGVARAR
jgi:hypothetical protein